MGGGVAILYKNKLDLKLFKTETFSSFEHVTCTALMETGKVYFTTVYYPGYSTKHKYTHMQFLSTGNFNDFLATCTEGIQLITGDFNIHHEDKNRPETKKFLNILHQHDFTQLLTYPTHVSQGTLDFLLINTRGKNYVENLNLTNDQLKDVSDYDSISFNLKLKIKQKPDKIIIKSTNLRLLNKKKFPRTSKKLLFRG